MRSSSEVHRRARRLRREMSPPEVLLWVRLRQLRGQAPTFRRQHPVGPYVADFFCAAARLVVEVDGASHTEDTALERDRRRDAYMVRLGYRLLCVPAGEVMRDPDEAAQGIVQAALALAIEG
ncbi:MAG: DUF559 domain-containing protein [Caulobacteraceae bacterium]|nr:DUF559 domain-containing protein [Caulobacteraceae bacterium]